MSARSIAADTAVKDTAAALAQRPRLQLNPPGRPPRPIP